MSLNFCQAQTLIHSVSTRSFYEHMLPQFLKNSGSFYPYILAHFQKYMSTHFSQAYPLILQVHNRQFLVVLVPSFFTSIVAPFYPYMLAHSRGTCPLIFTSIVAHSIRTYLPFSRSTCSPILVVHAPSFSRSICSLIFLKNSGSFYPYTLAYFQKYMPTHFSQAQWFILSVHTRPFIVVHAHSFFATIVAHSVRTYSPILVVHAHSFFSSFVAHSIHAFSPVLVVRARLFFLKHSGAFFPYILANCIHTCSLTFQG